MRVAAAVLVGLLSMTLVPRAHAREPVLLAAGKKGKAAEEEARKAAEEAARKAAEEEAAKKAAEEEAARKAAEEEAAKKAAQEEAAKKAEAEKAAAAKPAEAAPAATERFADLGFKDKYFDWSLPRPEALSPQVEKEKKMFLILTILASFLVPFPELWLPMVMWDPKPHPSWGEVIKPYVIKNALWIAGHLILLAPAGIFVLIPFYGPFIALYAAWFLFIIGLPLHLAWYGFNLWTGHITMLKIWDDQVKNPQPENTPPDAQK